jgi:acyl carrier protein
VNSLEEFVSLVRDEVGLPVTVADAGVTLDDLPGWDSVHLLTLLVAVERATGRPLPMPDVLEAPSLHHIYALAVNDE